MPQSIPVIKEESCLGCALCEEICPEVFQFNEALGYVLVVNPIGALPDKIQEVMDACPSSCIFWSGELGTNQE